MTTTKPSLHKAFNSLYPYKPEIKSVKITEQL